MDFNLITCESLISAIIVMAEKRFVFNSEQNDYSYLINLAPTSITNKALLRIKRNSVDLNKWKTILIVIIEKYDLVEESIHWAAVVKDELLEPENGDLYLFAVIKDESLSINQCTNIEASDRICRKYILRPEETIDSFLGRSFISPVMSEASSGKLFDPLHLALESTSVQHEWFDSSEQERWQEAFLSGKNGQELIELLFNIKL